FISNLTGQWISPEDAMSPGYWSKHIRETVRFADGLTELLKGEQALFIEVGPGNTLSTFTRKHKDKKSGVVNLVRRPNETLPDDYVLLKGLGKLWGLGLNIDWLRFHAGAERRRIALPTYSFDSERYARSVRETVRDEKGAASYTPGVVKKESDIGEWFYLPQWAPSLLVKEENPDMPGSSYLVFLDETGVGSRLVQQLKREGERVVTVSIATAFAKTGPLQYRLNPRHMDDYNLLFQELKTNGGIPGKILHLWGVTGAGNEEEGLLHQVKTNQEMGFYSLLYLARAVDYARDDDKIQILVITDNMQEVTGRETLCPGKATVLAPVIVIPQEYPEILCRSIDIETVAPGSWQEEKQDAQLVMEAGQSSTDTIVAYRRQRRSVRTYHRQKIEKTGESQRHLKKNGVYLITGGLGFVGLSLAKYLAGAVKARLILVGRSALPDREHWQQWLESHEETDSTSSKIRKLHEIEALGGETLLLCADVAKKEQMERVFKEAERNFGTINGVIHAAGDVRADQFLRSTVAGIEKKLCEEQFQAKIYGTLVLEELLETREPDFCSLTSSLSSVLGGVGFIAYAAGNLFMDSFIQRHNRATPRPWTSVNWDGWMPEATKLEETRNLPVGAALSQLIVTPQEGTEVFARILSAGPIDRIVVSVGDLERRIDTWVGAKSKREKDISAVEDTSVTHSRPDISGSYMPPRNKNEKILVNIWQNFFGINEVGIRDDFFELGGDSLQAVNILNRVHKEVNLKLSLHDFFDKPTIEKVAASMPEIDETEITPYSTIEKAEVKKYYPLSKVQKRLYAIQQMDLDNIAYNESIVMRLEGAPEIDRIEKAFIKLIERHESFRTTFKEIDGAPVQEIHSDVSFAIETTGSADGEGDVRLREFLAPFTLSEAPLLRVGLIKTGEERYLFIISIHHMITDGISVAVMLRDFNRFYRGEGLPPLRIQYKDYTMWQMEPPQLEQTAKQKRYWQEQFSGSIPVLQLPTDYPRPGVQSFEGNTITFEIHEKVSRELHRLAEEHGFTLYILLLALFNILLSKYSGQEDIIVASPSAGRRHADLENIIGIFVNTLVMRNAPQPGQSFLDFLTEVKQNSLHAFENQDYQFDDLLEHLELKRDRSRNPLFDAMFTLQNAGNEGLEIQGLTFKPYEFDNKMAKFDLSLDIYEGESKLFAKLEYCIKLFKKETMQRFINHFLNITEEAVANPASTLTQINMLSEAEEKQLLYEFNNTQAAYPKDKTIHQLFAEQVERTPDLISIVGSTQYAVGNEKIKDKIKSKKEIKDNKKIKEQKEPTPQQESRGEKALSPGTQNPASSTRHPASSIQYGIQSFLSFPSTHLTYRELNKKSNQLANLLIEKGVESEGVVGIMLERSIEMIIAIMGILKAGAAYLPIDPDYPKARKQFMLTDSSVGILLSTSALIRDTAIDMDMIRIDEALISDVQSPAPGIAQPASGIAYVIYTSGSTGNPKGVVVEHRNVNNLIFGLKEQIYHRFEVGQKVCLLAPFVFDA
ncbi:MAG: SDR family oxidoreductase, partial [bacterium]|nr:SDR family oxidoreductase [bacterium]